MTYQEAFDIFAKKRENNISDISITIDTEFVSHTTCYLLTYNNQPFTRIWPTEISVKTPTGWEFTKDFKYISNLYDIVRLTHSSRMEDFKQTKLVKIFQDLTSRFPPE
jgi:hypothetical protein